MIKKFIDIIKRFALLIKSELVQIYKEVKNFNLKEFINGIAIDKKDHILLGIIIGFPLVMLFGVYGGLIGIFLVGAKEVVHDWLLKKGNPEWLDFIASAVPIVMFIMLKVL